MKYWTTPHSGSKVTEVVFNHTQNHPLDCALAGYYLSQE